MKSDIKTFKKGQLKALIARINLYGSYTPVKSRFSTQYKTQKAQSFIRVSLSYVEVIIPTLHLDASEERNDR